MTNVIRLHFVANVGHKNFASGLQIDDDEKRVAVALDLRAMAAAGAGEAQILVAALADFLENPPGASAAGDKAP